MQPKLEHDEDSDNGWKQLASKETKSKVEGMAHPQVGHERLYQQERKHQQAQAYVGQLVQGTQFPCVPSLTYEMLTTLPAPAFPGLLSIDDLLNTNSQEVWAQFNSSFPTESFPAGLFDQEAGAIFEKAFVLNNNSSSSPAAASDQSALPQVEVNVSQLSGLLPPSLLPPSPVSTHIHTETHHGTARHGKPHLLLYIQLLWPSRSCRHPTPIHGRTVLSLFAPSPSLLPCFCSSPPFFSLHLSRVL